MLRVTDQYFWNFIFIMFFVVLIIMGVIILDSKSHITLRDLSVIDMILITLASWRVIQLFLYDDITKWFREQFWDASKSKAGYTLKKPKLGPRRTLADLLSSPWCFGAGAGAMVTFFYLLTPLAFYPVLFLAVAAAATFLQILSSLIGHWSDQLKHQNERGF